MEQEGIKIKQSEQLSYKDWGGVLIDLYRQKTDKNRFIRAMKEGSLTINGVTITPLDFFSTSKELTDAEIKDAIAYYLEIDNIDSNIEKINEALYHSRKYIEDYLLRKLPREINNLEIKNTQDVLKIFRKTSTLKARERQGFAPAYCELIKTISANFMFEKEELQYLMKETKFVYNELFDKAADVQPINIVHRLPNGYDKIVGVQIDDLILPGEKMVMADAYYRGKSRDSFVTKFLIKPDNSVQEAIKDGIGLKMEADSPIAINSLMGMILRELFLRFHVQNVNIENTHLFDDEQMSILKKQIKIFLNNLEQILNSTNSSSRTINVINDSNVYSDSHFRAIKICEGKIDVPRGGIRSATPMSRNFEVQFVLSSNSNESGFSNHHVYDAKKKLAVTTRNIGPFSEKYVDAIVYEASYKSGLRFDDIKKYFLNEILSKIIVPSTRTKRFVVKKRVLDLMATGIFYQGVKL